jgi:hypothetical protein
MTQPAMQRFVTKPEGAKKKHLVESTGVTEEYDLATEGTNH